MSHSDSTRRVVVTGMAAITPLGSTLDAYRAALRDGRSGVRRWSGATETSAPLAVAGEAVQFTGAIDDFGPLEGDRKKAIRKACKLMCRETQMAVAAAQMALADAKISDGTLDPERAGVVLGSDYMLTMPEDYSDAIKKCAADDEFDFGKWGETGLGQMTPLWMLKYLPNMPASHVAIFNDLRGPNNSLTMREASSLMAIGEAFRTIARGHADVMVCGATGTRILPMQAIHVVQTETLATAEDPTTASRPFDAARTGMVAGEGAAILVLEELGSAQARGATIYGEVLGFGSSAVADTQLRGNNRLALANAMRAALTDADLDASGVGHINAHGLATKQGDADEAAAIADVLGEAAQQVPVTALKSYFGNLGAGSGTAELIASLIALEQNALPKTLNYSQPDPACPISVTHTGDVEAGATALAINVTPQGQAASLVVGLYT